MYSFPWSIRRTHTMPGYPSDIVFFIVSTRLNTCPARPRVVVNFLRFPFSKSCSTEVYDRCVMFADKSSWPASADPLSRLLLSFTFTPPRSISFSVSLPSARLLLLVASLNNKYERVLREYPEGAISGVQASDHPLAPFETVLRLTLAPVSSSTTRNASLIHLEEKRSSRL